MSSKFSKLFSWLHRSRAEEGQAMVMVALSLVVMLGFGAFAVDLGHVAVVKSDLQNAADAAALAGASDLSKNTAGQTAVVYAGLNGMKATQTGVEKDGDIVIANTPYYDEEKKAYDDSKIEVVCSRKVQYYFAGVLGFKETKVSARAVAQNMAWAGDALPFINLNGQAEKSPIGQPLDAWDKVNPGDKERIHNNDLFITPNSIRVNLADSKIQFKKGRDMSKISDPLEEIVVLGKTVYIISIKKDKMQNYTTLNENQKIPASDTVLLECQVTDSWDNNGHDTISLKFINSYNWNASQKTYLSTTGEKPGGSPTLVE